MSSDTTMREARSEYFEQNGFGPNGGYDAAWVDFSIGPIPFPFPNTAPRVRAVRYHDLHHVLTGYRTDFSGEMEIAAWEIGAGCRGFLAAWQLNLAGMATGSLYMPRRVFRAFVRGRRSSSLYGLSLDELLDSSVSDVRARLGVPEGEPDTRPGDYPMFALAVLAGLVTGVASLAVFLPLLPIAYIVLGLQRRKSQQLA